MVLVASAALREIEIVPDPAIAVAKAVAMVVPTATPASAAAQGLLLPQRPALPEKPVAAVLGATVGTTLMGIATWPRV